MKLHTAGSTEPQRWACCVIGAPSSRPRIAGTTSTGTSWKCSFRWSTDSNMRWFAGIVWSTGGAVECFA